MNVSCSAVGFQLFRKAILNFSLSSLQPLTFDAKHSGVAPQSRLADETVKPLDCFLKASLVLQPVSCFQRLAPVSCNERKCCRNACLAGVPCLGATHANFCSAAAEISSSVSSSCPHFMTIPQFVFKQRSLFDIRR